MYKVSISWKAGVQGWVRYNFCSQDTYLQLMNFLRTPVLKGKQGSHPLQAAAILVGLFLSLGLNCDVGEDSWESLGLQGDPTSPS